MKKNIILTITSVLLLCFFSACGEIDGESPEQPVLETNAVINIRNANATFQGKIFEEKQFQAISYGFAFGKDNQPTVEDADTISAQINENLRDFSADVSGLQQGETYYVRAYVIALNNENVLEPFYADNVVPFNTIKVLSFEPEVGFPGSEITISGENFSSHNGISVSFVNTNGEELSATYMNSTESTVTVEVPKGRTGDLVGVLVTVGSDQSAATAEAEKDFEYVPYFQMNDTLGVSRGESIKFTVFDNYEDNDISNMRFKFDTLVVSAESSEFIPDVFEQPNVFEYVVEVPNGLSLGTVKMSVYLEVPGNQTNTLQKPILPLQGDQIEVVD